MAPHFTLKESFKNKYGHDFGLLKAASDLLAFLGIEAQSRLFRWCKSAFIRQRVLKVKQSMTASYEMVRVKNKIVKQMLRAMRHITPDGATPFPVVDVADAWLKRLVESVGSDLMKKESGSMLMDIIGFLSDEMVQYIDIEIKNTYKKVNTLAMHLERHIDHVADHQHPMLEDDIVEQCLELEKLAATIQEDFAIKDVVPPAMTTRGRGEGPSGRYSDIVNGNIGRPSSEASSSRNVRQRT